jgi:hypothetical protein
MAIVTTTITEDLITVAIAQTVLNPISFDPSQLGTMAAQDADDVDITGGTITNIDYMALNLLFADGVAEGRFQWNAEDGVPEIGLPGGNVNLQIGQEQLFLARNITGLPLSDGTPVRIDSAVGSRPTITSTDLSSIATAETIGLTTEPISNNSTGYVTRAGLVRGINTLAWPAGTRLFASAITPGELSDTLPGGDFRKIFVGVVLFSSGDDGIIITNPVNIFFLQELSGMNISSPAHNDLIAYDSATNTWRNVALGDL